MGESIVSGPFTAPEEEMPRGELINRLIMDRVMAAAGELQADDAEDLAVSLAAHASDVLRNQVPPNEIREALTGMLLSQRCSYSTAQNMPNAVPLQRIIKIGPSKTHPHGS